MWSLPFILSLFAYLLSFVSAQCPAYNGTTYTDQYGANYTIYCNYNTAPNSYGSLSNINSLADCVAGCTADPKCLAVTLQGTNCYLKSSFDSAAYAAGLYSAARVVTIPYPAPQANYVNASAGCGTPLPAGMSAGGATTTVNFTAPDGTLRSYNIHIPSSYDINKAAPLIVTFHGQGSNPTAHESETRWSKTTWNPYGVVVYPAGIGVSQCGN